MAWAKYAKCSWYMCLCKYSLSCNPCSTEYLSWRQICSHYHPSCPPDHQSQAEGDAVQLVSHDASWGLFLLQKQNGKFMGISAGNPCIHTGISLSILGLDEVAGQFVTWSFCHQPQSVLHTLKSPS